MPTYKAFEMTIPIFIGLYVLREQDQYTSLEIVWIYSGAVICLSSLYFINEKKKAPTTINK